MGKFGIFGLDFGRGRCQNGDVMKKSLFLIVGASLFLSSCCTFVNGRHDDVAIRSSVPEASVYVDGVEKGKTPCAVEVKRTGEHKIEIQKAGYFPYQATTGRGVSWWLLGNAFIGGIIGLPIDLVTGAWADVTPDEIDATLTPLPQTATR